MFPIGDSIFVTKNSNGASNSGLIVGKKGVMMVDSTFFPSKAKRIVEFLSNITSKVLLYVINTHYHVDHILGNCAVDAPVIGSTATKEYIEKFDLEAFKLTLEPFLQRELKDAKLVPPSVTFRNRIKFELGDKSIEIVKMGGHTPDSSVVYVWPDAVCFCGDLLFSEYHAEIESESDLNRWIQNLKKIKEKPLKWVVPGHGPVGGIEELDDMILYLEKFRSLFSMFKLKRVEEIVDKFGDDPILANRGFTALFEESLTNYLRRDKGAKHTGSHKT